MVTKVNTQKQGKFSNMSDYQVGLGERIGEGTQAVLNVLLFPKRKYRTITYREGISHNAFFSEVLDLNLLKIIWCHLSLFKILL